MSASCIRSGFVTTYDRLSEMTPSNDLGENRTDIDDLDLAALFLILRLWHRVGDDELFEATIRDSLHRFPTQDPVSDDRIHLGRSFFEQAFGCQTKRAARIGHVVDQDRDLALDTSDEHHPCDFRCLLSFLVEEGKVDVQSVGDRGGTESATENERPCHGV